MYYYDKGRNPDTPVSINIAARFMQVKLAWLKEEAEAGRLPAFQAGDRWLFHLPTLERAMQDRVLIASGVDPKEYRERSARTALESKTLPAPSERDPKESTEIHDDTESEYQATDA